MDHINPDGPDASTADDPAAARGPDEGDPNPPGTSEPLASGTPRFGSQPPDQPVIPVVYEPYWHQPAPRDPGPTAAAKHTDPQPRRTVRIATVAIVGLAAGVAGAALTAFALSGSDAFQPPPTTAAAAPVVQTVVAPPTTVAPPPVRTEIITPASDPSTAAAVAVKVVPSIVTVEIGGEDGDGTLTVVGSGSGVVLTEEGLIVTNHHVVEDAAETQVVFQDGRIYRADIIGTDPVTDLAVLSIDAENLTPIELGSATGTVIGDTAIAVGNPLGLAGGPSLTVGVVSAQDREVVVSNEVNGGVLYGMIQTDAPITRGSSGGALVDEEGRLIGITTAIGVSDAGAEGIGFAIPVELMTRVTDEIVETGGVRHTFLGVLLQDVFVSEGNAQTPAGASITEFVDDSAAEAAGLLVGDQIIGFEGDDVRTKEDIIIKLRNYRVGDEVHFIVIRDGETLEFDVALGERPAS